MTHLEKLAREYEVEDFFDYIIESQVNGNLSQVRELAGKLYRDELVLFCVHALFDGGRYGRDAVMNLSRI